MEVAMLQLPPGDPGLIDKIVCQLKSNGIFDQFRKECIADVDTKPAYQNLRQRVEGSVSSFLTTQEWRADLNKNQLRDSLRKHIHESGFLDIGVERIVDQVVNPKIYTVFFPKVEDVVYGFLGVEKPKKGADIQNSLQAITPKFEENPKPEKKFVSLKDLLPTDLDPISPEKFDSDEDIEENSVDKTKEIESNEAVQPSIQKVKVKEESISDVEHDYDEDEKEDEEDDDDEASPPFESLEGDALDTNATPPVLPLHSADMLDNITSSSSSSETKDLLQYGEVRKRYPDPKLDYIKKEVDGVVEKHLPLEPIKTETTSEICVVKKEEREKKEAVEPRKEWKKVEKKEEKFRDNGERKDESRNRKSVSDSREGKEKHAHEKKRNDRDQVSVKQEKDDRRSEKEEQKKVVKEEHKKSEKDDHRKSEKDEVKKSEKEKDESRKSDKGDKKHVEKDEGRKVDKERDSSRRHDRDKEDRKNVKERDEKRSDKDKKYVREKEEIKRSEKDDHRKSDKEKDDRKSDRERNESKKRDKKDEKKPEKEKDEKKTGKEKDDTKKSERDDSRKSEKEENRKGDKEKDKHRSGKDKIEHSKGEKDVKERIKSEHKEKDIKHGSSKSSTEMPKKDGSEKDQQPKLSVDKKKEDVMKKPHHHDSSKTSSSKDKKVGEKEKKVSSTDDHRHERDKGKNGHRRSDRDKDRERERSQADGATHATLGKDGGGQSSSTSSTPSSSEGSKGGGDSSSGGGGGSERTKEEEPKVKAGAGKDGKMEVKDNKILDTSSSLNNSLILKIKKPKIAANIYEVKKIIQVRKNLKKLERERLALSNASKVSSQKGNEIVIESPSKIEDLSETKSAAEPPKVKRAKLGAVEQDLRGEVESVLEKSLLEGEDGEIGEVRYLEDNPNVPDFVHYVHSLAEAAATGDYSRIPSPTNSIATAEFSDFEDNVILSDVELSKEEEELVTKLGGHIERKSNKLKSPKKSSPSLHPSDLGGEGSNKRPRRPNPRYNSGEYTVYSDEDEMTDCVPQKSVTLVDGMGNDHWKTPKERSLEADDDVDAVGHHESSGIALPTPENDAGSEDRETPVLSKKNQAAAEERRRMGRRLGVRGPLRRVAGISPGTPDTFVMPLSPESDVSTASGDAGKKASLNTKENQYHQGDMDGELGPEDYDDVRGSEDGDTKQSTLPLGPPLSSAHRGCDIKSHAGDLSQSHDEIGHPSSGLPDGERRIDDPSGLGPRRLRGTRSSSRVQQRYSSDDLYKPRPNITLGRRNRGRNSPTQDESPTSETTQNCPKQGRRGSSQGSDEIIVESCMPNKRRRR